MNSAATPDDTPGVSGDLSGHDDEQAAQIAAQVAALFDDHRDKNDQVEDSLVEVTVSWLIGKRPSSRDSYLAGLASWLRSCRDPLRARPSSIGHWLEFMTVQGPGRALRSAAPTTLAQRLTAVSSWYGHLMAVGACAHNPAAGVRLPRATRSAPKQPPALSIAATAVLVEHALARAGRLDSEASWRDASVIATLFITAIGVRALIAADLTDLVGLSSQMTPLILRTRRDNPAQGAVIELPPLAGQPLRAYLTRRATRHHLDPSRLRGPVLLTTPSRRGTAGDQPLTAQAVASAIARLADQAGVHPLPRITPCPAHQRSVTPRLPPIAQGRL